MTIETEIDQKAYIKLIFQLTYKQPGSIFIQLIGLFALISSFVLPFTGYAKIDEVFPGFILSFIILGVKPLLLYFIAKRNLKSNQLIKGKISYQFEGHQMKTNGANFSGEYNLNAAYKIEELNDWFLIYQNKQAANLIPKSNLSDDEIWKLRSIFVNLENVKRKLKYK